MSFADGCTVRPPEYRRLFSCVGSNCRWNKTEKKSIRHLWEAYYGEEGPCFPGPSMKLSSSTTRINDTVHCPCWSCPQPSQVGVSHKRRTSILIQASSVSSERKEHHNTPTCDMSSSGSPAPQRSLSASYSLGIRAADHTKALHQKTLTLRPRRSRDYHACIVMTDGPGAESPKLESTYEGILRS